MVFLAGLGGTTRYWERRVMPLGASHRLLLIDLLGFGRSPKPWVTYTIDRHVAELHRILDGENHVALVGHSFGAIAAVAYAARYPRQVERLVLMSLPYFGSETRAKHFFRQQAKLESWLMTNMLLAALACIITRRVLRRALPRYLPDMPREVLDDLVQHTWRSSTSTLWEGIYRYDLARDAKRLPAALPVLLLHGDRDTTAPLEGARQLAAFHPNATLMVLPGVDHHPLLRDAARCVAAISSFCAAEATHLPGMSVLSPEVAFAWNERQAVVSQ
jgi:pimeloyl-ACP methyl ester carboxylesterase